MRNSLDRRGIAQELGVRATLAIHGASQPRVPSRFSEDTLCSTQATNTRDRQGLPCLQGPCNIPSSGLGDTKMTVESASGIPKSLPETEYWEFRDFHQPHTPLLGSFAEIVNMVSTNQQPSA